MRRGFDLSFRYKLPLWGSGLIVVAALAVSAALMAQAYDDLRQDLLDSSAGLGRTLARNLFPAMLNDEIWRAFEILRAPLSDTPAENLVQPEVLLAVDQRQQVFVSTDPDAVPMLAAIAELGEDYRGLAERVAAAPETATVVYTGQRRLYVAVPIADDGMRVGTLVIAHSKDVFLPRFRSVAWRGALTGLLVLALLLPINWYWGQRMAGPLVELARSIGNVAAGEPHVPPSAAYPYRDELGRLFDAYGLMVRALQDKDRLEQEVIRSERLAAVGRLSAGIAHEINNPLGGMLVALDNFKLRGGHDERTLKTVAMIERGLAQIRETVGAMLVEAKVKSRDFGPHDVDDLATLLAAEARKRAVAIHIDSTLAGTVPLPAAPLRQILMNLLLNAVQASDPATTVYCAVRHDRGELTIDTRNAGRPIPQEVMNHLFEPFSSGKENGSGLGLWVTYQIVSQLGGRIATESVEGSTSFVVVLPTGEPA